MYPFPLTGAAAQILLLGFLTGTVALYAARHGVHGLVGGDLTPTWPVFVAVAPVLVYNFLGLELPSTAAEELRDPRRDVPASIVRAGVLTCALYAVPVLAIVLVVPAERITGLTGFIDALAGVFVVYGRWSTLVGAVTAAVFAWVLLANGTTWIMGAARTQVAASLDGAGPRALGRVSARTGTPVRAAVTAGLIATGTAGAAFALAGHDNEKYFSVVLALSLSLVALANLAVFPALARLRRTHPEVPRPFRVPGGTVGALAVSGLATGWVALALAAALWPGLASAARDTYLPPGFEGNRTGFLLTELVLIAGVIAIAVTLSWLGRRGERAAGLPVVPA
jgi:glutamate:GABA antiporter